MQVEIGNAHYYGRGGLPQSHKAAVERYVSACSHHVPEVRLLVSVCVIEFVRV